jgi:hypothetical protein
MSRIKFIRTILFVVLILSISGCCEVDSDLGCNRYCEKDTDCYEVCGCGCLAVGEECKESEDVECENLLNCVCENNLCQDMSNIVEGHETPKEIEDRVLQLSMDVKYYLVSFEKIECDGNCGTNILVLGAVNPDDTIKLFWIDNLLYHTKKDSYYDYHCLTKNSFAETAYLRDEYSSKAMVDVDLLIKPNDLDELLRCYIKNDVET